PKAMLGGTGSGLAYAGNGIFLGLPDRGPNATVFDKKIDDTVSFIPRFDTLKLDFTSAAADAKLPLTVNVKLTGTTLLWSATPLVYGTGDGLGVGSGRPSENTPGKYYFTGRSDAYDPSKGSCNPADGRLDSESIRVSDDGKSVFISDEYGPYLYQFDRATGERVKAFALPQNLCVAHLFPTKKGEKTGNDSGRTPNKGMEGLAITPDGKMLVGAMQAALLQDHADKATKKMLRLVSVDLTSGTVHEYGYMLTEGSGVSDIVAVNDHEFLVDERDGDGLGEADPAKTKGIYLIDLNGAKDITDLNGKAAAEAAVKKTKFFDLVPALEAVGVDAAHVPSK
ncbi:esterase-like activity of phytase family protein, partial [Thioclava sp. BHET1]